MQKPTVVWLLFVAALFASSHAYGALTNIRVSLAKQPSRLFSAARKFIVGAPVIFSSLLPLKTPSTFDRSSTFPTKDALVTTQVHDTMLESRKFTSKLPFQFVRTAAQHVGPSVVRIDCDREISPVFGAFSEGFREGDTMKVSGTGIIMSNDGYIVTNAHVVDQARRVSVTLSNGRTFKATVTSADEFTDLAVIKIDATGEHGCFLTAAPLGDSASLHSGDWVVAVGCPVGLDFTVTLGVVSNPKRSAAEVGAPHLKGSYIQTDAALNSGNSGGPLVNDLGEVVGINTMVRTNTEAIGFAIPINRVKQIYSVLRSGKKPTHAYFGMEVMSITPDNVRIHNEDPNSQRLPETQGALVMRVVPGSPADKCGLRRNDIIVGINSIEVKSADETEDLLDRAKPGASCALEAAPQDLHVMLEEKKKLHLQHPMVVLKPKY
jgi:S1-C subfamily serine protease